MKLRFPFALLVSLLIAATAQAKVGQSGIVAASMPIDLHLVACHATLAALTILGIALSLRRWPWAILKRVQCS